MIFLIKKHDLLKERDNLSFYYDKYEINLNIQNNNILEISLDYFYHFDLSLIKNDIKEYLNKEDINLKEEFSFKHNVAFFIPIKELEKNDILKSLKEKDGIDESIDNSEKEITDLEKKDVDNIYIEYIKYVLYQEEIKKIIFNIGIIEGISYYKILPVKNYIINTTLKEEQKKWWSKIYFKGLGEYRYLNNLLSIYESSFINFISNNEIKYEKKNINIEEKAIKETDKDEEKGIASITENNEIEESLIKVFEEISNDGFLVPIGGGKDSCVTLSLLNKYREKVTPIIIGEGSARINCIKAAGYNEKETVVVKRNFDQKMIQKNNEGFFNGHVPFSAILAFITMLPAYILKKKYIVLSNESSANESTVKNLDINHQYSKTIEFEEDFRKYIYDNIDENIEYFSLLRPIKEVGIAKIFSKLEEYYNIFKSCNVGSKEKDWKWCCNCPKCLFVYIILAPFMYREKLVNIFGEDLFENEALLDPLYQLIGITETKPFECVGTIEETIFSLEKVMENMKNEELPILLEKYQEMKEKKILRVNEKNNLYKTYDEHNFVPEFLEKEIKQKLLEE